MHAVFMGTTTASRDGGGGEASLPTSHDAGKIDTANVACMSDI